MSRLRLDAVLPARPLRRVGLVFALLLTACTSRWLPIQFSTLPGAEEANGAPGFVLSERTEVRFHLGGPDGGPIADEGYDESVRVYTTAGQQQIRHVESYNAGFSEVLAMEAQVVKPDGAKTRLQMHDAADLPMSGASVLFSSNRARVLDAAAATPGSVWQYHSESRELHPQLFPIRHAFQGLLPKQRDVFVVRYPADWEVDCTVWQGAQRLSWQPVATQDGDERMLTWTREDVPAQVDEPNMPPLWALVPVIHVRLLKWRENGVEKRSFADNKALSAWLHASMAPSRLLSPALAAHADALVKGATSPQQKLAILEAWVRREVSYCAVEIGMGGWIPHPATQVYDVRNGDCKDKANLLQVLLAHVGVPSRPAILFAHDGVPRPFVAPTLANCNHEILVVDLPDGPVVVDPTARYVPVGELPDGDSGTVLLPISATGSDLMEVPPRLAAINQSDWRATVRWTPEPQFDGRLEATGSNAWGLRALFIALPPDKRDKELPERLLLPPMVLEHADLQPLDPDAAAPAVIAVRGKLPALTEAAGAHRLLLRAVKAFGGWLPLIAPTRKQPFVLGRRRALRAEVTFELPETWQVVQVPPPVTHTDGNLAFKVTWRTDGHKLILQRELAIHALVIPVAEQAAWRAAQGEWIQANSAAVVLQTTEKP